MIDQVEKNKETMTVEDCLREDIKKLKVNEEKLKAMNQEIKGLINLTNEHVSGVFNILSKLETSAPNDYRQFNQEQKNELD